MSRRPGGVFVTSRLQRSGPHLGTLPVHAVNTDHRLGNIQALAKIQQMLRRLHVTCRRLDQLDSLLLEVNKWEVEEN